MTRQSPRGMFAQTILVGLAVAILFLAPGVRPAGAQQPIGPADLPPPPPGEPKEIPGQFIVVLKRGVGRNAFINARGLAAFRRYTIINGFAARMSQQAADRLAANPQVRSVTPDLVVHAFPKPPDKPGKRVRGKKGGPGGAGGDVRVTQIEDASDPEIYPEEVPTGVSRIGAESAWASVTGAGVKVAVIDTGIDCSHPDLVDNCRSGVNLVAGEGPEDLFGHGTHVAGIIGAVENEFGVVGVAPEVELYAVKVLNKDGSGTLSDVIAGIDWARDPNNDGNTDDHMDVANLSLGGFDLWGTISLILGNPEPMCDAVANAVAAGVTVVAAAGNSRYETLFFTPAHCPSTVTVSAFADLNGLDGNPGGEPVTINGIVEYDETFANSFSNHSNYCWDLDYLGSGIPRVTLPIYYAQCTVADSLVVNLMAPGVNILSTLPIPTESLPYVTLTDPNGDYKKSPNYDTLSGTSMAAPHVAGAAALYIQANPGADPEQVRVALTIGDDLTTGGQCVGDETGATVGSSAYPLTCPAPWPDDPNVIYKAFEPLVSARDF